MAVLLSEDFASGLYAIDTEAVVVRHFVVCLPDDMFSGVCLCSDHGHMMTVGFAVADPAVADPVVADPVVADPAVADPAVADPAVADPAVADPAAADPAAGFAVAGPVAVGSAAVVGSVVADPAEVGPAAADEVAAGPLLTVLLLLFRPLLLLLLLWFRLTIQIVIRRFYALSTWFLMVLFLPHSLFLIPFTGTGRLFFNPDFSCISGIDSLLIKYLVDKILFFQELCSLDFELFSYFP